VNFFDTFLSNLLATIVGVGLGIPAALWINRQIESRTEKVRKEKILKVLLDELKENSVILETWKGKDHDFSKKPSVMEGILPLYVSLYTESWDAFSNGGELEWINDPVLLNILATSYNRVSAIRYIANKFFDLVYSGSSEVDPRTVVFIEFRLREKVNSALANLDATQEYIEAVTKKKK